MVRDSIARRHIAVLLIAGEVILCVQFCTQLTKAYMAKTSWNQLFD